MDDFLEEYKHYYRVRYERMAGNPKYPNSTASEKAIYDAMDSCNELSEFRDKLGNLNEMNAIALVKDQETIRRDGYLQFEEKVRALGPQRILEKADQCNDAQEVITLVGEETNKNSVEISMDEAVREFNDWKLLEDIQINEEAEVPDRWKADQQKAVDEYKAAIRESYASLEEQNQPWQAGWKMNFDLIWEHRHRRLLPVSDEVVQKRLNETKSILGR